jgi:hypothetical protein
MFDLDFRRRGEVHPINGFFLFELGSVASMAQLPQDRDLSESLVSIGQSAGYLRAFKDHPDNQRDLPDSVNVAAVVFSQLEALMKLSPPVLTQQTRFNLIWNIAKLHDRLSTDLPKVYSFVLDDKRGHSVESLWRKPLDLMHTDAVPLLSDFVIENLEEAGKCLVLDRSTAAGFHTMRSVECVARKYFELVTGRPTEWKDPDGKPRFKMFGQTAQELQDKAEARLKKHEEIGDLGLIAGILKPLGKLYRDPLAHSDLRSLDENEAMTAFNQGLDVIAKMGLDAKKGGPHFHTAWVAGTLF